MTTPSDTPQCKHCALSSTREAVAIDLCRSIQNDLNVAQSNLTAALARVRELDAQKNSFMNSRDSIADQLAESFVKNLRLTAEMRSLRDAAQSVLADFNGGEKEELKPGYQDRKEYWSPAAGMVHSMFISKLRSALDAKGGGE